jgi:hypothetical protein
MATTQPYVAPAVGPRAPAEPGWAGRVVEFLVVGGVTPLCFVASWLLQRSLGLDLADLVVGFTFFHLAFIVNDPHFSVTYLLFYEDFKERAFGSAFPTALRVRYLIAGVAVPVALVGWALVALTTGEPQQAAERIGWMIQLMFLLVGWHYVKQGFGVMMVLSARRGVRFDVGERRVILAHCFSGWAYAWANPHHAARLQQEKGLIYTAFGRPQALELVALGALVVSTVALVAMLWRKRRRQGRLPIVTPLVALLCSVWTWMIFSASDPLVRYMAPALHSLQYLYFVWLLRRNEAASRVGEPHYEAPPWERMLILALMALGLGWLLFHGAPTALDDLFAVPPRERQGASLGVTPYFAALYTIVNLHHYFMDNVIWRRDNERTRFLTVVAAPRTGPT